MMKTISSKISVTLFLVVLIPMLIVGWYSIKMSSNALKQNAFDQVEFSAKQMAEKLNKLLYGVEGDVRILSEMPPVQGLIRASKARGYDIDGKSSTKLWVTRLQNIFASYIQTKKIYFQLRYIDRSGKEIVRVDYKKGKAVTIIGKALQNKSAHNYFKKTMQLSQDEMYVSPLNLNREHGQIEKPYRPVIRFAVPVFDQQGNRQGIVIANVLGDLILNELADEHKLTSIDVYLVNREGYFLYHPEESKRWGFDLGHEYTIKKLLAKLETNNDSKNSQVLEDLDGQTIAYDFVYPDPSAHENNWRVIYKIPLSQILSPVNQFQFTFIVLVIIATMIAIAIGLFLSHKHFISPISHLLNVVNTISHGDLSSKISSFSRDEIGQLGQAVNTMSDNLVKIVSDVQKSGIQLSSSATTMAATAKEQEVSAKEQEATTNQIMAASREIALTSKGLATNMDEVARVVDDTAELAEQGRNGLNRMGNTIGQMVDASHNISSKLAVLNEKASNITSVVTTINKVADQTNLLSVNAAIEADKAGEYGIGFGTVATEIRRLADQTAVATYDIEEMVKEMQSAVSAGVMGMEKFSDEVRRGVEDTQQVSEQLSQIVEQVQALAPHFESVHEGMHSQSQGAEQIQDALVQLSETIRGMNDSLRQSNTVVMNLNSESDRLQSAVSEFKLER